MVWIPNLLSIANLFFGFSSMLAALRGRFDLAVIFIFLSMLFDMFDGRIARMINKDNPMGKELDSFADLLSFGVAPGVIFYAAFLGKLPIYDLFPNPGLESNFVHLVVGAGSFIFPSFAALRLARYNTQAPSEYFSGCPSTTAGGMAVFLIAFNQVPGFFLEGFMKPFNFAIPYQIMIPAFLFLAILMVVPIPFSKPQKVFLNFGAMRSLKVVLINLFVVAALLLFFKFFLLILSIGYILFALVLFCKHKKRA